MARLRTVRSLAAASLLVAAAGCRPRQDVRMLGDHAPAGRTAASFVHCVEAGTSLCVKAGESIGGWDAFFLLTWLASGSPTSILEALPRELSTHADPLRVQARFVQEVERYAAAIRGAECDPADVQPLDILVDKAANLAETRLAELGLWQGDMQSVVAGFVAEAHEELGGGSLVRLDCGFDPYHLYVATHERDGQHRIVGMTTLLPTELGGAVLTRGQVDDRLHSGPLGLADAAAPIQEGAINFWLPFPVEVF